MIIKINRNHNKLLYFLYWIRIADPSQVHRSIWPICLWKFSDETDLSFSLMNHPLHLNYSLNPQISYLRKWFSENFPLSEKPFGCPLHILSKESFIVTLDCFAVSMVPVFLWRTATFLRQNDNYQLKYLAVATVPWH
jgi:hypothetical protein